MVRWTTKLTDPGDEMPDTPDARRKSIRIPARQGVWCEGPNLTLFTHTSNLSAEGAFVRVPQPLQLGERLQLRFADIGATFETEVVWARKSDRPTSGSDHSGVGVRFLSGEGRGGYEELLKRLADDADEPATSPRKPPPT